MATLELPEGLRQQTGKVAWWRWPESADASTRSGSCASRAASISSGARSQGTSCSGSRCSSRSVSCKRKGNALLGHRSGLPKAKSEQFLEQARNLLCEMIVANERGDQRSCSSSPQSRERMQLKPLNGRVPSFPPCDIDSPRWSASRSRSASTEVCQVEESGCKASSGSSARTFRDSFFGHALAPAAVHVGASANSVLAASVAAVEPAGSPNEDFCRLLREALASTESVSRPGSPVTHGAEFAGCRWSLPTSMGDPLVIGCA